MEFMPSAVEAVEENARISEEYSQLKAKIAAQFERAQADCARAAEIRKEVTHWHEWLETVPN